MKEKNKEKNKGCAVRNKKKKERLKQIEMGCNDLPDVMLIEILFEK